MALPVEAGRLRVGQVVDNPYGGHLRVARLTENPAVNRVIVTWTTGMRSLYRLDDTVLVVSEPATDDDFRGL